MVPWSHRKWILSSPDQGAHFSLLPVQVKYVHFLHKHQSMYTDLHPAYAQTSSVTGSSQLFKVRLFWTIQTIAEGHSFI